MNTYILYINKGRLRGYYKEMLIRPIMSGYVNPIVARPSFGHGFPLGMGTLPFARPVCSPVVAMNPFMQIPVQPMVNPFFAFNNVFIQNMKNVLANFTRQCSQNNQMFSSVNQFAKKYKFGSLTSGMYKNASNSYLSMMPSGTQNLSFWQKLGYNVNAGVRLAKTAVQRAVGFTGYCAKYVKNAIAAAGLGNRVSGNAYEMINILRRNRNFKEIPVGSVDLKKLPAGCILVYGKGQAGYSKRYGHTEITTGTGRAVSDGITNNIRNGVTAIFIPV